MLSQSNDGPSRPIFIVFNGGRTLPPPYRGSDGLRHLLVGPVGHRDHWNPGAQRFKGYTAGDIIGQHFSRFYTEQDQKDGLPSRALGIARRDGKFEAEGWHVRKDGSNFGPMWLSIRFATHRAKSLDTPRSHATLPSEKTPRIHSKKRVNFAPCAENGGDRPAHRRNRTRF